MAEHPFILEFPVKASDFWPLTNYRRMRDHRELTLLLNVLLAGNTSYQPPRSEHFWALILPASNEASTPESAKKSVWRRLIARARKYLGPWLKFVPRIAARKPPTVTSPDIRWVQQHYFAPLGEACVDELSPPQASRSNR
jgi:hypothetical protein